MRYSVIAIFATLICAWGVPAFALEECRDAVKTVGSSQVAITECMGEDGVWREEAPDGRTINAASSKSFHGKISYRGAYRLQDTAVGGGRTIEYTGTIDVTLEFNGTSVDGSYSGTGKAGRGALRGQVTNGQCRLNDNEGTWVGPCGPASFSGSYFGTVNARHLIHMSWQMTPTQVTDYDRRDPLSETNAVADDAQRPQNFGPARLPTDQADAAPGQARGMAQRQREQSDAVHQMMEGCRSGHWLDCSRVEEFLPAGSPEALEAGLKGCALEDRGGCYNAGLYYEKYSSEPNRLNLAVKYFKTACDDGLPEACVKLSSKNLGSAGAQAAGDLAQTNEKLCNSGNGSACNSMGISLYNGELVAQNRTKSLVFFARGCKLGNKTACENATKTQAELNETKRDVERKAAVLAARADPAHKPGADLSKSDLACLSEEQEVFYTYEEGECLGRTEDPYGAPTCSKYDSVKTAHTKYKLRNRCKMPISIEEYCGSTAFAGATLLPGDVYTRRFLAPCRLAY
jgi:hypothetical protein